MLRRSFLTFSILAATIGAAVPVHAQIQRTIVNTGFEGNDPGGPGAPTFQIFSNGAVLGWDSTSGSIELWDSNFQSVPASAGLVFAEMNANAAGALFQTICFVNGEVIKWRFAHRARSGGLATQTARFEIANSAGTLIQNLQTSAVASTTSWTIRTNTTGMAYTGPSGLQRVQFSTPDPGSYGNFLDEITVGLTPYVELAPSATTSREGGVNPSLPALRVTGNFTTSVNVTVNVSGGNATLGSDFTTPSGTSSFIVTIPAGNYQSVAIPMGVAINQDNVVDSGETIQFSIGTDPSNYTITSTTACGGTANTSSTHTILDDQIQANDQTITNVNGNTGANAIANVLSDDVLEGQPVNSADVNLTLVTPATPIGGGPVPVLTVATGDVNVPPGTPAGTYIIRYQICQRLDPALCSSANITIAVAPSADLAVLKTNTPGENGNIDQGNDIVVSGATTTYVLIVTNNGPDAAIGATVSDVASAGLTCPATNPVTITGNGIPAGSFQIADLLGPGITLAQLGNGQSTTLRYSCQVN